MRAGATAAKSTIPGVRKEDQRKIVAKALTCRVGFSGSVAEKVYLQFRMCVTGLCTRATFWPCYGAAELATGLFGDENVSNCSAIMMAEG